MLNVKVKQMRDGRHPLPAYATKGDAGVDLHAYLEGSITLDPGERALIPLGVAMSIPHGYELQLRPRSGNALKRGITLLNAPGTIDETYRGEIGAIVINHSPEMICIKDGEKIAQGVFNEYKTAEFEEVNELDETERGTGGFGHSGL